MKLLKTTITTIFANDFQSKINLLVNFCIYFFHTVTGWAGVNKSKETLCFRNDKDLTSYGQVYCEAIKALLLWENKLLILIGALRSQRLFENPKAESKYFPALCQNILRQGCPNPAIKVCSPGGFSVLPGRTSSSMDSRSECYLSGRTEILEGLRPLRTEFWTPGLIIWRNISQHFHGNFAMR